VKKSKPTHVKNTAERKNQKPATPLHTLSKRRIWLFRMIMIFLVPALIIGLLELVLKVAGYGYPTSYFVESRIDGRDFLIPNHQFSNLFFPPKLARTPSWGRVPAEKPAGSYRIFVFGESAALGDPDPSYGFPRYLKVLLEMRYPDAEFEVICTAMTAINSHAILPIAREAAGMNGDLWVIYMGNNEMVGPFGAGTIFGAKAPALGFIRTSLALKKTRLGQLMSSIAASRSSGNSQTPATWQGINMFKKNLLRYDDRGKLRAYRNFTGNLEDIMESGRKAGVPIILSTVGSNLKDCSPHASLHREDLDTSSKRAWDALFQEGMALEKDGRHEEALIRYSKAEAIDSEYAELHFRMGACRLAAGRADEARQAFALARDYDALAVRADTLINRIVMDAALEGGDRVFGMHAEDALSARSPQGISGQKLFYEHVHLTAEGNYTLARLIADQVRALLPPDILESETENWLGLEACSQWLCLTALDELWLWQQQSQRSATVPFISQSSNPRNRTYINRKIRAIKRGITSSTKESERQWYVAALERTPDDPYLLGNYAQYLDATGKKRESIEQAEKFCALLPDLAWAHYYLAALQMNAGMLEQARSGFARALEINPDFTTAQDMLMQLKQMQKNKQMRPMQ
jgi:tetratricopeptide (TPR) repeat protein